MRRNALAISIALVLTLTLSGCAMCKKDPAAQSTAFTGPDAYNPSPREVTYDPDPYPTYGTAVEAESTPEPVARTYTAPASSTTLTATPAAVRYHTVVKKDTLYSLARKYYGDHRRWKEIYEANSSTISNPDKILVGNRLVIP